MSTAVAAPPVTVPPTTVESALPRPFTTTLAASSSSSAPSSLAATPSRFNRTMSNGSSPPERTMAEPPRSSGEPPKRSPTSARSAPKIVVKKEPSSPDLNTARHRPRKLDLSAPAHQPGKPTGPLTSKESGGLVMQDVGLHCISPGFHTQDPSMREQLQRSIDVRERQRQIIEARQKGHKEPADNAGPATANPLRGNPNTGGLKTPGTSKRKGPPPGLSITAPSAQQFANERVIQTAPINSSFTGLNRPTLQPASRQVLQQPSLGQSSHIHHVPANQTNNRLPPISDVFPGEIPSSAHGQKSGYGYNHSPGNSSHSNVPPALPSPGFPHHQSASAGSSGRRREYKSAEEAVQSMTNGREELLPRIVHYPGHQPPTPPSPMSKHSASHSSHGTHTQYANATPNGTGPTPLNLDLHRTTSARRRGRDEYERDMGTPPLRRERTGPFGEGRDSPETMRRKKEEFIRLCDRAWDLFHS